MPKRRVKLKKTIFVTAFPIIKNISQGFIPERFQRLHTEIPPKVSLGTPGILSDVHPIIHHAIVSSIFSRIFS